MHEPMHELRKPYSIKFQLNFPEFMNTVYNPLSQSLSIRHIPQCRYISIIYTVKNKVCIPHVHQVVYHMTLHSVNYPNYSVISTPQCHITHCIFTVYVVLGMKDIAGTHVDTAII